MAITTEEFIARFHSLTGITSGERRKNLCVLLNEINRSKPDDLNFSLLIPKTPLEEKFKVETLIHLRKTPELLEVLRSENVILIERILSVGWFLDEAFQNITGEQLVTEIFPYISFNAKLKLLNKLPLHLKSTQQADAYFEAVEKKYGFYLASKLLPACNSDLIINCLKLKRITFTPRQLLGIIKNNPKITESILKVLKDKTVDVGSEYKNIFVYLSQQDKELFCKLYGEYNLRIELGWRKTSKLIQLNKEDVIQNPNKYYNFLHKKQIAKSLDRDFKVLYRNLFPKSLEQLQYNDKVFTLIKQLPRKMKNVLFTTFESVYGSQLWDHEEYRDVKYLKILAPKEREVITTMENKPRNTSEEEWYCYMKTEKSIPYLKKTISLTSDISKRVNLVRLLVETCYLNEDKVALLNMCKYMLTKHRNDNVSVRRAFLIMLKENFKLSELGEEYWTVIKELLQLFTLNNESFDDISEFNESYIHYCLKNNLPIKEHLIEWLQISQYNSLNIIKENPKYEKKCLLMFGELIPELYMKEKEQEEELDGRIMNLIKCLVFWNERHPEDPISIFSYSYAINKIKQRIESEDDRYTIVDVIKCCLKSKADLERKKLLSLYITRTSGYVDVGVILWLIRNDLLTVIDNIDALTRIALDSSYYRTDSKFFWKFWRNHLHLEQSQKITNICMSGFKENTESSYSSIVQNSVIGLSYLLPAVEFQKFAAPYNPTDLRANSKTNEELSRYTIQKYIGNCLKNLNPASLALESILQFCKGDYLKLAQSSLYSTCGNVNEDKLPPFFNELSTRAVSVRKHAMHLAFRTLNKEQIYIVLNKFMETEKNASVRKFIFKSVFNFFVLNADEYTWELFKTNVNALDIDDNDAMEILMQREKIPINYIPQYIVFTWGVLNKLPDSKSESSKGQLISLAKSNIINLLPKEFCNEIIAKYFFNTDDASLTSFASLINTFTSRYIIYADPHTEQEERLNSNFEKVKNFVSTMWNKPELRESVRNYVADLLKEFCLEYLNEDCKNKEILIKFANFWYSLFKPHQAFDEYLHLQFTLFYFEKLPIAVFGQLVANFFEDSARIYGVAIAGMFAKKITFFSKYIFTGADELLEEQWYVLIHSFLTPGKSVYSYVLAILLLNDHKPRASDIKVKYETIINLLERHPDPILQLYLENHFRTDGTTLNYY